MGALGRARIFRVVGGVIAGTIAAIAVAPPLFAWRSAEMGRQRSISNLHAIATGLLLYAQDWDDRLMPVAQRLPNGKWRTWDRVVTPMLESPAVLDEPDNPVIPGLRDPIDGYPVRTAYALNNRFWNTFGPGPFPITSLDLSSQTALVIEAGPMWRDPATPPRSPSDRSSTAKLGYGDIGDTYDGFFAYPSPHDGRICVVAADGRAATIHVSHYSARQDAHDRLYGRIGGTIFNWNGGHPNGQTDRRPRD